MQATENTISVVTFNTLGAPFIRGHQKKNYLLLTYYLRRRFSKLASVLNDSEADVLALQEVHLYPLLFLLKRRLTNYPYIFYKPYIYGPRGGMVMFSKYPLSDCHYIDFKKHGSFRDKSFIFKITQNGIVVVRVAERNTYVLNTTVSADADHDWSPQSKYNSLNSLQLSQIAYTMNTLAALKSTVIAVGDFNMKQDSALYHDFCAQTNAENIFAKAAIPTQHPDFLPKDLPETPRLDYVFVKSTRKIETVDMHHLFRDKFLIGNKELFLSDHLGLFAKLSLSHDTHHHTQSHHYAEVPVVN